MGRDWPAEGVAELEGRQREASPARERVGQEQAGEAAAELEALRQEASPALERAGQRPLEVPALAAPVAQAVRAARPRSL